MDPSRSCKHRHLGILQTWNWYWLSCQTWGKAARISLWVTSHRVKPVKNNVGKFLCCNFFIWQYVFHKCPLPFIHYVHAKGVHALTWLTCGLQADLSGFCLCLLTWFCHTTLPIYSSSHSASGPGQSLRLFMPQTVLLNDKTEGFVSDWMFCAFGSFDLECVLLASSYCNWKLVLFACDLMAALILPRVHIWWNLSECI